MDRSNLAVGSAPQKEADPGTVAAEMVRLGDAAERVNLAVGEMERMICRPPQDEKANTIAGIPPAQRSALSSRIAELADRLSNYAARIEYVNEAL